MGRDAGLVFQALRKPPRNLRLGRRRFYAMLGEALRKLSAEVDKAATAPGRPSGHAIRRKMVQATHWAIDIHRLTDQFQAELDDTLDVDRAPCQIVDFPAARLTLFASWKSLCLWQLNTSEPVAGFRSGVSSKATGAIMQPNNTAAAHACKYLASWIQSCSVG